MLDALRAHGLRGVVATGWGGIAPGEASSDDVLVIEGAPHDWLFDRVRAVVHHGGAGSTAAGLRAGRPTLVVPFLGDQPFWGSRVHGVGAGPAPLPARRLARGLPERLGDLVGTPSYATRAAEVGAAIRAEDGTGAGCGSSSRSRVPRRRADLRTTRALECPDLPSHGSADHEAASRRRAAAAERTP